MPYDANVAALQSAVNRFAAVGGFGKVSVDGLWGPNTINATYKTLAWMAAGACAPAGCIDDDDAATANALVSRWDQSAGSAGGLTTFITHAADEIGLPYVATPVPSTTPIPSASPAPWQPPAPGIWERLRSIPTWQKVGLGLVFGFGALWMYNNVIKRGVA